MEILVIAQKLEGQKKPFAAFTTQAAYEKYSEKNELSEHEVESIDVPVDEVKNLEYLYLAYFNPTEEEGEESCEDNFIGYHTNRFNAQQAVYQKGFIRSIRVYDGSEKEADAISKSPFEAKAETLPPIDVSKAKAKQKESMPAVDPGQVRMLAILSAILVAAFVYFHIMPSSSESHFAIDEDNVDWLPPYCKNVSYYLSPYVNVYEFSLSSSDFEKYVKEEKLRFSKIEDPVDMNTYRIYIESDWKPSESKSESENQDDWLAFSRRIVSEGYEITAYEDSSRGSVKGAFDEKANRAYVWTKPPK